MARLGGDEFIALLPDLKANDPLPDKRRKNQQCANPVILIHEHVITISGSIGIALFPHDAADADTLLNSADKAMYSSKKATPRER